MTGQPPNGAGWSGVASSANDDADAVIVWGNCQAPPVAELLAGPLRDRGLRIVSVPPVYLIDEVGLQRVRQVLLRAAVFICQPIRDEYRLAGCGSDQLADLLPSRSRVIRFPVAFDLGPFPYQCNATGAGGERVLAPLTDYHDLRTIVAAERGMTPAEAMAWYPAPPPDVVRSIADGSRRELARREVGLDVAVSDLLDDPKAMFTISHPTNVLLARIAQRIVGCLGWDDVITVPEREYLGARRAPVEIAVTESRGWPAAHDRRSWVVDGHAVPAKVVVRTHLEFYRSRPDIVGETRRRQAVRLAELGL